MTTTELKEPSTPIVVLTTITTTDENSSIAATNSSTTTKTQIINKKSIKQENVLQERDKESFYKDVQNFHENRNTPITRFPKISGANVDLHRLYSEVISRGGWLKVNGRNEWEDLTNILGLSQTCVNASVALKHIYARYLDKYEKLNFLGEDPDRKDDVDDDNNSSRHKKWSSKNCLQSVPMIYNTNQHNVTEYQRIQNKLSTNLYKHSEYEKLLLSLMSPLPNEQDFAINVCTLMTNEGKHTLKIEKCPKILDFLLAHAGVYTHITMRNLFQECYNNIRRHSLQSFWNDLLKNNFKILQLSFEDSIQSNEESKSLSQISKQNSKIKRSKEITHDDDENLFAPSLDDDGDSAMDFERLDFLALGRGLGTHEYIGQRVQQIASIIRNLSFFDENLKLLGKNRTFLRFIIMCMNIRWGSIHQMALDVCGNIAHEIQLQDPTIDDLTHGLLTTICDGLEGQDRGVIISCLEILNKLSQQHDAHDIYLHKCIDQKIYNQICLFLSLNDIMLLLYTLECIYGLSSLGHHACTSIIQVRGIIDTLISLITVEAQSYGPDGCILMRVVETVPGNMLPMVAQNIANLQNVAMHSQHIQQQQQQQQHHVQQQKQVNTQSPPIRATSHVTPTVPAAANAVQSNPITTNTVMNVNNQKNIPSLQENEQYAISWLSATFESAPSPVSRVEQQELYKMYISAIHKSGRRSSVTPSHFPRIVRSIFGTNIGPTMLKISDTSTGIETNGFYYICMRVRANPLPLKGLLGVQQQQTPPIKLQIKPQTPSPLQSQLQQPPVLPQNNTTEKMPPQQQSNQQPTVTSSKVMNAGNIILNQGQNQIIKTTTIGQTTMTSTQITNSSGNSAGTAGGGGGILGQSGTQSSTSLIKSLLANKVTTTTTTTTDNNSITTDTKIITSAASNNPSGLIVQNINLNNQLAQRQNLAKQKEVALQQQQLLQQQQQQQQLQFQHHQQQQQQHGNIITTPMKLATTTISALVNNPIIQSTPVKVGQTTIKPINPHTIEKKTMIVPSESLETGNWDPVPPLAPLSSSTVRSTIMISSSSGSGSQLNEESINSMSNHSLCSTQIQMAASSAASADDGGMEGTVISFDGLLIPKSKSGSSSTIDDDNNSKDSVHKTSHVINANQMLVDLLDKKSPDPPHNNNNSGGGGGVKRKLTATTDDNGNDKKKLIITETTISGTPQPLTQNAANLYAEMAASILEDEDLDETTPICVASSSSKLSKIQNILPPVKTETTTPKQQQIISMPLQQRQIIMSSNNQQQQQQQIILQTNQSSGNIISTNVQQGTATIKTDSGLQTIPLIIQQKQIGPNGQQIIQPIIQQQQQPTTTTQYVLATNPQGQTYLVAQQTPHQQQHQQPQTLLVTQQQQQQQQGTPTKTIIILQQQGGPPQAVAQQQIIGGPGQPQKMIMTTPQGQQMIVTQMPRQVQHHQIIMNPGTSVLQTSGGAPVTSTISVTGGGNLSQNLIFTQSGAVFQQPQQIGQMQKQIQIHHHQQQPQTIQLQQTLMAHQQQQQQLTALQQQQQASLLSQLPQIPATIKLHTHQPSVPVIQQTQTTQTSTIKMIGKHLQQQSTPMVSIVAQTPTQPPLLQQPTVLQNQGVQQILKTPSTVALERKQIIVTSSEIVKSPLSQQKQAQPVSQLVQKVQQQQKQLPLLQQKQLVIQQQKQPIQQQQQAQQQKQQQQHLNQVQQASLVHQVQQPQQATLTQQQPAATQQTQKQITRTPTPTNITTAAVANAPSSPIPPPPPPTTTAAASNVVSASRPVSTPTPPILPANSTPPPALSPALPKPKTEEELIELNWLWICDWRGCPRKKFKSLREVYRHACQVHCPENLEFGAEIFCQWGPGQGLCDHIPRKRFSLMTHILDRHCTMESLKAAVQRRLVTGLPASPGLHQPVTIIKNMESKGTASPTLSTSSNNSMPSAASAAMHAIKRHTTDFLNPKELMDENEGPVTKSIRLTAALILRNLVTYTTIAKKNIRFYEPHLAGVALSNVESSRTISQILYELNN